MSKNKDLNVEDNSQIESQELESLLALKKQLDEEKERLALIALEQEEKQAELEKLKESLNKRAPKKSKDALETDGKSETNKIIIDEDFQFEIPVHGKVDVMVTVKFKKGQHITDAYLLSHVLSSDARYTTA